MTKQQWKPYALTQTSSRLKKEQHSTTKFFGRLCFRANEQNWAPLTRQFRIDEAEYKFESEFKFCTELVMREQNDDRNRKKRETECF